LTNFSFTGIFAFLQGVFVKTGCNTWFFGGELVVEFVVTCGELAGTFSVSKNAPQILDLFFE